MPGKMKELIVKLHGSEPQHVPQRLYSGSSFRDQHSWIAAFYFCRVVGNGPYVRSPEGMRLITSLPEFCTSSFWPDHFSGIGTVYPLGWALSRMLAPEACDEFWPRKFRLEHGSVRTPAAGAAASGLAALSADPGRPAESGSATG